jgi:hypothetical protein
MQLRYQTSNEILEIYEHQSAAPVEASGSHGPLTPTYKTSAELLKEMHSWGA